MRTNIKIITNARRRLETVCMLMYGIKNYLRPRSSHKRGYFQQQQHRHVVVKKLDNGRWMDGPRARERPVGCAVEMECERTNLESRFKIFFFVFAPQVYFSFALRTQVVRCSRSTLPKSCVLCVSRFSRFGRQSLILSLSHSMGSKHL
jgi:hypothetical protein